MAFPRNVVIPGKVVLIGPGVAIGEGGGGVGAVTGEDGNGERGVDAGGATSRPEDRSPDDITRQNPIPPTASTSATSANGNGDLERAA